MAHVMNYAELKQAAKDKTIIYEEIRVTGIVRPLRYDGAFFVGTRHHCYLMPEECDEEQCPDYNQFYRCWDEEPSEELMKATPWKESSDED